MNEPLIDVLERIVQKRRQRVAEALQQDGDGARESSEQDVPPGGKGSAVAPPLLATGQPFLRALAARSPRAIIAEVKMGSPKLGSLLGRFDPERQAELYAANGAAALSVVVEPDFFFGSYELLQRAVLASGLPAIAKDFIVDPVQLQWAHEAGASAVLLIAALYEEHELLDYANQARRLGLVPLIETHSREDLTKLSGAPWELVGVNNRDLRTFKVDLGHSISLLEDLPTGALRIAESGIGSGADVLRLSRAGFDGFLIGESLLTAKDPAAKLKELLG